MATIPNQVSLTKAYQEFDCNGHMKPSSFNDRLIDVWSISTNSRYWYVAAATT